MTSDFEAPISHVADDGRVEQVREHLQEVAEMAESFAEPFGLGSYAYAAGMMHDVGKYSAEFQKRIVGDGPKVDHSTAGAFELFTMPFGSWLSYCVAGHHGGIPDGGNLSDNADDPTMVGRLKRAEKHRIPDYQSFRPDVDLGTGFDPVDAQKWSRSFDEFSISFMCRMVFSCLVDADYLCTERFMQGIGRKPLRFDDLASLLSALDKKVESFELTRNDSALNEMRCALLDDCARAALMEPGLFTLTVPTGGGKTVASMKFALDHALAADRSINRVIYVAPYTSIIEQNAQVYRDIFGLENVIEHHSNFDFEPPRDGSGRAEKHGLTTDQLERLKLASENWDAPIVVTTVVQLFESLFSNKPSRCRKIHNIAQSVIILDEAQMLPLDQMKPCVRALSELINRYDCSVVLCTATQPYVDDLFAGYGLSAREIAHDPGALSEELKRATFVIDGVLDDAVLAERMAESRQALCIVNSRRHARDLFEKLKAHGSDGVFHLSTSMYPLHRQSVISEIRSSLRNGEPCLVVSTCLIEAGVDLDFPVVFREIAGLDSVVQSAGRCNREGLREVSNSMVHVFESADSSYRLPYDVESRKGFASAVLARAESEGRDLNNDVMGLVDSYFKVLRSHMASMDSFGVLSDLYGSYCFRGLPLFGFKKAASKFRVIEEASYSVIVPTPEMLDDIESLCRGEGDRSLVRRVMKNSVPVYEAEIKELKDSGSISEVAERVFVLDDESAYSDSVGLVVEKAGGNAVFF